MKRSLMIFSLLVTGAITASTTVLATDLNVEQYEKELNENMKENGTTQTELIHVFAGETINNNFLVRTYLEKGTADELWYTIELPSEIVVELEKIKDEKEKVEKTYEMLSSLYVQTDSWMKLNILAQQTNDIYPVTEIQIAENEKRKTVKKMEIILESIEKEDALLQIEEEEKFVDNERVAERYEFLPFDNVEESKQILKEEIKELKTINLFLLSAGIVAFLAILVGMVIIRRKGR